MTEEEWKITNDSEAMTAEIRRCRVRKLRLAAAAMCRHIWDELPVECRGYLDAVEQMADGEATRSSIHHLRREVQSIENRYLLATKEAARNHTIAFSADARSYYIASACLAPGSTGRDLVLSCVRSIDHVRGESEHKYQAAILRDIFGNPFRPVTFTSDWRTEAAVGIAAQMYDARDFGNMPILADALQDAGCEVPAILSHCREPGTHVRGCWVVDLVLGKS